MIGLLAAVLSEYEAASDEIVKAALFLLSGEAVFTVLFLVYVLLRRAISLLSSSLMIVVQI